MDLIRKSVSDLKIKDVDSKLGDVEFYFANFGSRDSDNDVILAGAYEKTIKENTNRIKHIKNHNISIPVGKLQTLYTDTLGAVAQSMLSKSTAGRDTLIEYEEGIITEHSQGFQVIKEDFNESESWNEIKEVKLWEVSSLTGWGANENMPVIGLKSLNSARDVQKAINLLNGLDNILHKSKISDERGAELQKAFDDLGKTMKTLMKPSQDTSDQPIDFSNLHSIKF